MKENTEKLHRSTSEGRDPLLVSLGERVRLLRGRRGLTRKALAQEAGVSERHLANLESGTGNATILLLRQLSEALNCSLAEIIGDETTSSAEWLLIRRLLQDRGEGDIKRARQVLTALFGDLRDEDRERRVVLIGLRGAGKSALGRLLAEKLSMPFVELTREIERLAGCTLSQLHDLYGASAYRRYERRALESLLHEHPRMVLASPGGIVSEPETFSLLLGRCFTVWLQATPEDHMKRVLAQGDLRPMAGNREAMEDLKNILASRTDFYAKADLSLNTSGKTLPETLNDLFETLQQRGIPAR